ncbi:hypothetical protein BDB00DRAFT_874641 [Zychaea mexicana]|uniref:uncharacterized protein n=1 Tax=Zychaea mexicana TaxID=64656 RepID=UPI0022FEC02B|nr:uncharacterized protein BDB00DRAFT_874641 [Zychaea mexicana]KAI9491105.1 hypothetical protein BDB00DRAFT_874641 [Zychaea mexicana]
MKEKLDTDAAVTLNSDHPEDWDNEMAYHNSEHEERSKSMRHEIGARSAKSGRCSNATMESRKRRKRKLKRTADDAGLTAHYYNEKKRLRLVGFDFGKDEKGQYHPNALRPVLLRDGQLAQLHKGLKDEVVKLLGDDDVQTAYASAEKRPRTETSSIATTSQDEEYDGYDDSDLNIPLTSPPPRTNQGRGEGPQYKARNLNTMVEPCKGCANPKMVTRNVDCVYMTVYLMRHHLLAATPAQPEMAFHLCVLEFYATLRGFGHTAVQAFGSTVSHVHDFHKDETLHKNFGHTFFKYLETTTLVEEELVSKNEWAKEEYGCPTCHPNCMFIAIDGNIQLERHMVYFIYNHQNFYINFEGLFLPPHQVY